ncbi:cysteine desulfurase [Candidatus Peregrinibacteria bacterium]|nr:cysteine desulfurase [Candidatus Peregrinibacteria bacterium]
MRKADKHLVYLDNAAATPVDPRVLKAMYPYFSEVFANPSAVHQFGQKARRVVDGARESVSEILECGRREIVFTSGGTEGNNLFILGAAHAYKKNGQHIITTKIEHDSVLKPMMRLEAEGFEVTYLDVAENGLVKADSVKAALRDDTILISVMYANNEIGTIQPIAEIAEIIKKRRGKKEYPVFHADACQAAQYLNISVRKSGVDAMTLNGGKIYGPKGSGVLFIKEGVQCLPQILGGGQEYGMRSGTENAPAIVGFARALEIAQSERVAEVHRLVPLRNWLIEGVLRVIPKARLNGDKKMRLPNNANFSFYGIEGETILMKLDLCGIAASAGSACSAGIIGQSHVIGALGSPEEWTHSATRFSFGRGTTIKDVNFVLERLPQIIKELREISPFGVL